MACHLGPEPSEKSNTWDSLKGKCKMRDEGKDRRMIYKEDEAEKHWEEYNGRLIFYPVVKQ